MFLLSLLFVSLPFSVHVCEHDYAQDKLLRSLPPQKFVKPLESDELNQTDFIRVIFNTDSIFDSSLDGKQCKKVDNATDCKETDILTDGKRKTINNTINNIKKYVSDLIKVHPLAKEMELGPTLGDVTIKQPKPVAADLYVMVVARPYEAGSSTLATAQALDRSQSNRPISGLININPATILENAEENEASGSRSFFTTLLHEFNHILCFSSDNFGYWPSETKIIKPNSYGMSQEFLVSKHLKEWTQKRFNVHSDELKEVGLELEDNGGAGTAGSHPSARLFFTDLMQGKTYGTATIGPIFFLSLLDSGWYELDEEKWSEKEEEFLFLDVKRTTPNERLHEKILVEPPRTSYPESYICTDTKNSKCFLDYKVKGMCQRKSWSEFKDKLNQKWYNPLNESTVGGDDLLDYTPIILPTQVNCLSKTSLDAMKKVDPGYNSDNFGETYGDDSVCAQSTLYSDGLGTFLPNEIASCFKATCGTDYRVRFHIKGKEFLCKEDGQKFAVSGFTGYVVCPPGKAVCANKKKIETINMLEILPDRGPVDGKNLVSISGNKFNNYPNLTIQIGPTECRILESDDQNILCQVQPIKDNPQRFKSVAVSIVAKSGNISTELPEYYTFTSNSYNAGQFRAFPALALLICSAIFAYFA